MLLLGDIALSALRVVSLTAGNLSWEYAEHGTLEGLPVQEFIARAPADVSIVLNVHPALGDASELLAQLRSVAEAAEVMALQTLAGTLLGYYTVRGLDTVPRWLTPVGETIAATVTLTLREHRAPPAPASPRLAVAVVADPQVEPRAVDTNRDPDDVPLSEIVRAAG